MERNDSESHSYDSKPEVAAFPGISDSFSVSKTQDLLNSETQATGDLAVDQAIISISKGALEKEFLFQSFTIAQPGVAMGNGNRSRIIAFRKRGDKLFMMEAVQGHSVTHELPQNLVLAEFPILKESENRIAFDFNAGMSQLFTAGDWYAHDMEGPEFDADSHFTTMRSRFSYIEEASVDSSNRLMIRQIAQSTRSIFGLIENNIPIEIKYYLSPYRPDPNFKSVTAKDMDRIGFFETAPELTLHGTHLIHATHFNPEKPIVYAISSNTPAEYHQAVKDGILYWNKAFGKEIIQVVDAPLGVTAPDPNYNVVQWVNWDSAGFAYADAQMDPRTGETLHAQVYLTSAFAFGGKQKARKLLHYFLEETKKKKKKKSAESHIRKPIRISLSGFEQRGLCHLDLTEQMATTLATLLNESLELSEPSSQDPSTPEGKPDSQVEDRILKASQDYIRDVTAHEIGHTLGLRHNFAGSAAANYSLAQRQDLLKTYFDQQSTPEGTVVSSSVMDYLPFEESILNGDLLLKQNSALEYDRKAIQTLYFGESYKDSELPLFCTDSHVLMGKFSDCHPFDVGSSFVEYSAWSIQERLKGLPAYLLETFIHQKAPIQGEEPQPVEKAFFPPVKLLAETMLQSRAELFKSLSTSGHLLKVHRTFPIVTGHNKQQVRKAELDYLIGEIERLGGIQEVFPTIPDDFAEKATLRFIQLLEKEQKGIGYAGQPYEFSDREMEFIKKSVERYFNLLQEALIHEDLKSLNGKKIGITLSDHPVNDLFPELFESRIQKYVYAQTGVFQLVEVEVPAKDESPKQQLTLKLPEFTFPFEIRASAAALLSNQQSEAIEWGLRPAEVAKENFDQFLKEILPVSLSDLQPEKLSKSAARWILENKKVSSSF